MSGNKFRTKARAIELLGRKQIRDDITALIELMKNAHDADAEYHAVEFYLNNTDPYVIIFDTGNGMTENDILNKWLIIGTDSKRKEKGQRFSDNKKRPLMGEKGIGRLASAALGEQLWVFTKATEEKWHSLYLNWNIFENANMYLDDVSIPLLTALPRDAIVSDFTIEEMKKKQLENIYSSAWISNDDRRTVQGKYKELYSRIQTQVKKCTIPTRVQEIIDYIDQETGHGTILLVQNLRLRWNNVFDKTKDRSADYMATQRYNRLGAFVDQFAHTYSDFEVCLFVDDEPIEFSHYIEEELYEMYDVKIKGEIRDGKFFGQLYAPNADQNVLDECNKELIAGLEVTAGIAEAEKKDCGPFQIELCHFENDFKNSGISEEKWQILQIQLGTVGGVKVFRDGVRVLPYGDIENDFLNIEQNRSKHAGHYLFSHRNLFGRIHINSTNNPELEDKSSREGLLENEQYHYFIQTLQNLLVTLARSYLTDARKESKNLRKTYVEYNRARKIEKEKEEEALTREKQEFDEYLKSLNIRYKQSQGLLKKFKKELSTYSFPDVPQELKYSVLMSRYTEFQYSVKEKLKNLEERREQIHIYLNPRFRPVLPENLVLDVEDLNFELTEYIDKRIIEIKTQFEEIDHQFLDMLAKWRKAVSGYLRNNDLDRYRDLNLKRISLLETHLETSYSTLGSRMNTLLELNIQRLGKFSRVYDYLNQFKSQIIGRTIQQRSELQLKMSKVKDLLANLYSASPAEVQQIDFEVTGILNEIEKQVHAFESETIENLELEFTKDIEKFVLDALVETNSAFNISTHDENYIGVLKEQNSRLRHENEVFADMANLGIAAEIVNHEFNQLFVNVNDGLRNLKSAGLGASQDYWVRQIEAGFKAMSSRYSQLSPMYRSYNLPPKTIKVKDLVDNITDFFASRILKNKIEIQNLVDSDFKLKLSSSKIYPVLSNLIDNSIFWLLNKPERIILIRSDVSQNTLYIEDSGPGVNPRIANKIFDPFFTTRHAGRGLGLTIVKKVLESQQHEISLIQEKGMKQLDGACFAIKFACDDGGKE